MPLLTVAERDQWKRTCWCTDRGRTDMFQYAAESTMQEHRQRLPGNGVRSPHSQIRKGDKAGKYQGIKQCINVAGPKETIKESMAELKGRFESAFRRYSVQTTRAERVAGESARPCRFGPHSCPP